MGGCGAATGAVTLLVAAQMLMRAGADRPSRTHAQPPAARRQPSTASDAFDSLASLRRLSEARKSGPRYSEPQPAQPASSDAQWVSTLPRLRPRALAAKMPMSGCNNSAAAAAATVLALGMKGPASGEAAQQYAVGCADQQTQGAAATASPSPPEQRRRRRWRHAVPRPTPVFWSGLGGYPTFRIPAVARASRVIFAFAEARDSIHDWGSIDLVLRTSHSGGHTWSNLTMVASASASFPPGALPIEGATVGNPVPIYLERERQLLLIFCSNGANATERQIRARNVSAAASRRVWLTRSADGGERWTPPREITGMVKRPGWTWYATGPGGGLQLRNGTIVVPCNHASPELGDRSHLLVSHDGGETWAISADGEPDTNEAAVAQIADGSIILASRDIGGVSRVLHRTPDLGRSWAEAWRSVELPETGSKGCQGAIISGVGGSPLFLTKPASRWRRSELTIYRSDDNGRSWPRQLVIHGGPAAYSSMAFLVGGNLGVLFEGGDVGGSASDFILFVRLRLGRTPILEAQPSPAQDGEAA